MSQHFFNRVAFKALDQNAIAKSISTSCWQHKMALSVHHPFTIVRFFVDMSFDCVVCQHQKRVLPRKFRIFFGLEVKKRDEAANLLGLCTSRT